MYKRVVLNCKISVSKYFYLRIAGLEVFRGLVVVVVVVVVLVLVVVLVGTVLKNLVETCQENLVETCQGKPLADLRIKRDIYSQVFSSYLLVS